MPSDISQYLNQIINAVYGEQVRSAIYNAISTCYTDVSSGVTTANAAASSAYAAASAATSSAAAAVSSVTSAITNMQTAMAASIESAVGAANTATASANTAYAQASAAAKTASLAAEAATTAAASANTAAASATTAAGLADEAKNAANTAAAAATSAASNANTAKDAANAAAASVGEAISDANAARDSANAAAESATTAAGLADAAVLAASNAISDCIDAKNAASAAAAIAQTAASEATSAASAIANLTVTATGVGPEASAGAVASMIDDHWNISFSLKQGAPGTSFAIKGNAYETVEALSSAITSPAVGDMYNVGSSAPYNVYRWTGNTWEDQGVIGGSLENLTNDEINSIWAGTEISSDVNKYINHSGLYHLVYETIVAALGNKVDKDGNKVLSTNDFTNTYKNQITTNATNINSKVTKETGKSLISDTEITRLASIVPSTSTPSRITASGYAGNGSAYSPWNHIHPAPYANNIYLSSGNSSTVYQKIDLHGSAISSINSDIATMSASISGLSVSAAKIGTGTLTTTATTLIPAVNEVNAKNIFNTANSTLGNNNAGYHNSIYRGKYLGSSVTNDQYLAIAAGTFDDLFIGDYWTIDDINYRIADFNYFYNSGDTNVCAENHVVIVPDQSMGNAAMNSSRTTEGGYAGCAMRSTNMATIKATIDTAFGSTHILDYDDFIPNTIVDGISTAGSWYTSSVELLTEEMCYGNKQFASCGGGSPSYDKILECKQLNLFRYRPDLIQTTDRRAYFLRNVASDTYFCAVSGKGTSTYFYANTAEYIRPFFCIIG